MIKHISIMLLALLFTTSVFAGSFKDNSNGTVTDLATNLMWQKCSMGQSSTNCTGTATITTWEAAISYCEELSLGGFADWRLPNIKELKSIADMTRSYPAINQTYFPATDNVGYWSSTTSAGNTMGAWALYFSEGEAGFNLKTYTTYVRCVRGQ